MGGYLLLLMRNSICAAVNSDIIEEPRPERGILLLSSLPHWLHCNILFLQWQDYLK